MGMETHTHTKHKTRSRCHVDTHTWTRARVGNVVERVIWFIFPLHWYFALPRLVHVHIFRIWLLARLWYLLLNNGQMVLISVRLTLNPTWLVWLIGLVWLEFIHSTIFVLFAAVPYVGMDLPSHYTIHVYGKYVVRKVKSKSDVFF